MNSIDTLTVEDILNTDEMKISNGEILSGKEYLDRAINAFELNPCDYYTAFKVLKSVAKGHDANLIVEEIKAFWNNLEDKY